MIEVVKSFYYLKIYKFVSNFKYNRLKHFIKKEDVLDSVHDFRVASIITLLLEILT